MNASDVLRWCLSVFLVLTGLGIAYVCVRLGGVFGRLGTSVTRVTDEALPILQKAQETMDGVNEQIGHVDEIMVTAVNAAKSAERTVSGLSRAVSAPVRTASSWAAAGKEAFASFQRRRSANRAAAAAASP